MSNSTWAAYTGEIKEVITDIMALYLERLIILHLIMNSVSNVCHKCNIFLIDVQFHHLLLVPFPLPPYGHVFDELL